MDSGTPFEPRSAGLPTIDQAIADFLQEIRAKSPSTRNTYATGLNAFRKFLATLDIRPKRDDVGRLPRRSLEDFYLHLVDLHGRHRLATVDTYLSGLRVFLRYLAAEELIPQISLERSAAQLLRIRMPKTYRSPRVNMSLAAVVETANRTRPGLQPEIRILRDRAILNVLYSTGMRRTEVASLDRIDVEAGSQGEAIITGKGNRQRVVFFDQDTLTHINAYLQLRDDNYEPLFIKHFVTGKPGPRGRHLRLSPQSIWLTVKRYASIAGVAASTHDFRHLKATTLLERGADLSQVQDLLGHASPDTTKKIYAHYSVQHLRSAFDRYSQPLSEALRRPDHSA
ncbi:MAG: tyrosine-type recombinase/integrase [Gammaproteobacteria bacterium]|nr:tyrosine-type recombinase/integrase [Gammaproteobacteria bacterium]